MTPSNKEAHARLMVLRSVVTHALGTPPKPVLDELFNQWPKKDRQAFEEESKTHAEGLVATVKSWGLWPYVSPKEQAFLSSYGSKMDDHAHAAATWRMEAAGVLLWAFGLLDPWPKLDEEISVDWLEKIPMEKVGPASQHPRLRPEQEIKDKREIIELWHWRVRTRYLIEEGVPFPSNAETKAAGLNTFDDIVRLTAKAAIEQGDIPEIIDEDFVFAGKAFRSLSEEEYLRATSIIIERHHALNWLCGLAPGNRWDETPTGT